MASEVLDPAVRAAIDQIDAGFDALFAAGIKPCDVADATVRIRELATVGRRAFASEVALLDGIDRAGLHRLDGHASAKVMVRHVAHLSDAEAKGRSSVARALRNLPEVQQRSQAGRIGPCQAKRIARAHANPRARDALLRKDRTLARLAEMESYRDFDARVTEWVRRVDEDGTADRNQRSHENRDAKLVQDYDGSWNLSGGCAALDGAQLHDILSHFVGAETLADWEKARAEHGDAATVEDLPRTDNQRRFDALFAIFQRAASAIEAGGGTRIVTNLVMDLATFERHTAQLAGAEPGPPDETLDDQDDDDLEGGDLLAGTSLEDLLGHDDPIDPTDGERPARPDRAVHDAGSDHSTGTAAAPPAGAAAAAGTGAITPRPNPVRYRCSTLDGRIIEAREAVARSLIGEVRRVVVGADGVVIDLGRRRRLFTGSAALAVKLSSTFCYWPGCNVPVSQCQTDHLIPWADHGGGSTDPGNGGPACGRHNRLKEHCYTATRDQTGTWHVTRPDGIEIT